MKLNLRTSVLLLALTPPTLTALLLGPLPTYTRLQDLETAHRQRGQAMVNQLAPAAEFAVFTNNALLLRQLALAALQEADVVDVVIRDASGETLIQGCRAPDGTLLINPLLPQTPPHGLGLRSTDCPDRIGHHRRHLPVLGSTGPNFRNRYAGYRPCRGSV